MFNHENYKLCIQDAKSVSEALEAYYAIPEYKQRSEQYGVVAIHIELDKVISRFHQLMGWWSWSTCRVPCGSFYSTCDYLRNPSVLLLMSELGMKFNQISFYLSRESWATDRPITYNQLSVLYNEALISKPSRMDEGCHYNPQQKSGGSSSWVSD